MQNRMLVYIGFVCLFHQAVTESLAPQVPTSYSQLEVTSEGLFPQETNPQSQSGSNFDADPDGGLMKTKIRNSLLVHEVDSEGVSHASILLEHTGRDKGQSSSSRDKSLGGVGKGVDDQVRMTTFLALGLSQS